MEPKYVKRRQNGLAVLVASIVLIVGTIGYVAWHNLRDLGVPKDYEGEGNGVTQLVQVEEGSSMSQLGPQLVEKNVVASEESFQTAVANNPMASQIQPGFFRLQEEMSAKSAVSALLNDENKVDMLDVPGGLTLSDVVVVGGDIRYGIYSKISKVSCSDGSCVDKAELERVAANVDPVELGAPEWALDAIRARGNDPKRLEGLIAPGQYVLDPNMSAQEILTDLITRSTKQYNETNIVERAQAMNLSPYELLTAASLVEREAPAGEFDKVARVILNRLAEPMRLEFDSTVNYDLADVELATTDEARARETPWNTYAKDGLPDTPIASPSEDAIQAMENPAEGDWTFFVTVDEQGTTVFSNNYDEHLANVDRAINSGILDSQREGEGAGGSDVDAALHYLARMIEAGEDPRFIARRLMVHASEDIGMADPTALHTAVAAAQAAQLIGLPEARIPLAQATIHLATAPKSNAVIAAISAAQADVAAGKIGHVPPHLRDGHYEGAKKLGHAVGYKYPHDDPRGVVAQQYLPDELAGAVYYEPTNHGAESRIRDYLGRLRNLIRGKK
ncbi:endolytic transglycosylase MltG [Corynebacterium phoceense]|uniref:endolytic transglycosylase MltG n=1 Tax=Corynebacterium phoceense TaxID=1686286 RepID=UPI00098175E6|nr:endolytic transglycosylase MltG [Corynebacterium phoceense]